MIASLSATMATQKPNLIFAMAELHDSMYKDLSKLSELQIADKISDVADRINAGRLAGLWVPTHFVHDCERDDLLCWLLDKLPGSATTLTS